MLRKRFVAALGFALVFGSVMAAPAAAETVISPCSGTCGYWQVNDTGPAGMKGGVCQYETGSYDLDSISVRPPLMHGPYSNKTKVQWKFNILRSTNFGGSYTGIYNSSWQTAMANDAIPASDGSGFSRRYWYAPDPNPTGWFKVRLLLWWKNSAGTVVGKMKIEYDHYQGKWNGNTDYRYDYCLQDW
ncbi:MAG: hypothetical protein QFC55_02740 [Chloroflexota bacterium]|nr:hypothetical protein [Chloroflexota bacterium]